MIVHLSIEEPDWGAFLPDASAREAAHREWLRITSAMRDARTLAPENRHQIQRLVLAYARYDSACVEAFRHDLVVVAPRTGTPMRNPALAALRAATKAATVAERELGLSPRRRISGKGARPFDSPGRSYLR